MKRRSFLKGLLGLTAVSVAGCMRPPEAKGLDYLDGKIVKPMDKDEKSPLIGPTRFDGKDWYAQGSTVWAEEINNG